MNELLTATLFIGNKSWNVCMKTREFTLGYSHEYENALDKVVDFYSKGSFSKAADAAETALSSLMSLSGNASAADSYGTHTPLYKNVKSYKGTSSLSFDSSLTFYFRFGMNGDYSGKTEVVEPIEAIAKEFAAYKETGSYGYLGPAISKRAFTGKVVSATVNNLISKFSNDTSKSKSAVEVNGILNKSAVSIMNSIGSEIVSDDTGNKFVYIQFGKMPKLGPFYVKNVSTEFDFTNRDTNGYPASGSVTLGGLVTPEIYTDEDLKSLV